MRTRRRGRIINVASNAGMQAIPTLSAYVVSKTALIRFSEALALETVEDGIQVFAIHPGVVRTPMNDYLHNSPEVAKSAPGVSSGSRPCTLKDSIRRSSALCTWCCDSPLAMPMRSPAVISVWRMTSTH
jgi:NAD(P)-dependent dehydrogenase (short-subunit alcohol dehydrogenase family)